MSRFAALRDEDENDQSDDEAPATELTKHLSPQYTIKEILDMYPNCTNESPPQEATLYENIFISECQPPECNTFQPPSSEINSPPYVQNNKQTPRNFQSNQTRRPVRNQTRGRNVVVTNTSPEECGQAWLYRDPMDHVIGPYSSARMKEWLDKKYIDKTLYIRSASSDGKFQPISVVFPDISLAFQEETKSKNAGTGNETVHKEKRLITLASFNMEDKEEDVQKPWDQTELIAFK